MRKYVKATLADPVIGVGDRFTITGRILPSLQTNVLLEAKTRQGWQTLARGSTDRDGRYSVSGRVSVNGVGRLRIRAKGDNHGLGNTSRTLTLTVR